MHAKVSEMLAYRNLSAQSVGLQRLDARPVAASEKQRTPGRWSGYLGAPLPADGIPRTAIQCATEAHSASNSRRLNPDPLVIQS